MFNSEKRVTLARNMLPQWVPHMRCNRDKITDMRPIMKRGIENADGTYPESRRAPEPAIAVSTPAETQAEVAKVAQQLWEERHAEGDLAEQDWRRARVIVMERLASRNLR